MIWLAAAHAADLEVHVRDRADGDPVADAVVAGDGARVVAGPDGVARVSVAGDGPWSLVVSADGFLAQTLEVTAPLGGPVRVWLVAGGGPLEVVVEGLKPVADATRHAVDAEQAEETPGTLDDAVRLVQSLPGVAVQREYSPGAGELLVRGAAAGDTRTFLDGIEIPYLYHYNQYASVFPATQVDRLELYPSTFSARYGDAVGAVVEARSALDPPEAVHGGARLDLVMGGADVRAPVGRGWWVSASGRRSYLDLIGESSAQYTVWPTFGDFVVRAEHGDAANGAGVFAFGAFDAYTRAAGELALLDPLEASTVPYLAYRQGFEALGVRGQWTRPRADGRCSAGLVRHGRTADLSGRGLEDLDATALVSRLDASGRPEGRVGWDAGTELRASRTALVVEDAGDLGLRVAEEAPALARGVPVDDRLLRAEGGAYGIAHVTTGPVRWMPGVRADADSTAAEVQLSPRATARWTVGDEQMVKASVGRYAQRPPSDQLLPGTGDPGLPTTVSWQVAVGWEQTVARRLELGVEAYRKWLVDPVLLPIDAPPVAVPRGDAVGVELVTRYRLREVFFLWGWVAVGRTTLTEADGRVVPADGDQLVSGGLVASWDVGRTNLGARYRVASGLPFTGIDGSVYDAGNDAWVPLPGPTNGERLPDYHKVDLHAAYRFALRGWSLELVAEVWWVPRSSAQLYPTWSYDYTEQGYVIGPSVLPLVGMRARF